MPKQFFYTLLLLFFTPSLSLVAQEWEPVCEQGICIQPFDDPGTVDINDVPNVYAEAFRLRPRGNSGSSTDFAVWSDNTTSSFLLLSHTDLSSAYEYRIRAFAKSLSAGKTIDFGLTIDANLDTYQSISENHSVDQVNSIAGTGAEIISAIFNFVDFFNDSNGEPDQIEVGEGGDFYVAILPRGASSGNTVMIDDYVLERRALPMPSPIVDFFTAEATTEEGVSTSICLTISNPADAETTAIVKLDGTVNDHFSSFTEQSVIFAANATEDVCFELTPAVLNEAGEYVFYIESIAGEAEPEIGELHRFTLSVAADDMMDDICQLINDEITICPGECVLIGCENEEASEDICFSWLPTNGISDGYSSHGAMIEVCPEETTTYTVYITDLNGDLIETKEVVVNVQSVNLEITSSVDGSICKGESVTLTGIVADGNADSYAWSTGETSNTIEVSPHVTTTYTLSISDENTGCVIETSIRIQVYHSPEVEIMASTDVICELGMEGIVSPNEISGQRSTTCEEEYAILTATYDPGFTYLWSTGETEPLIRAYGAETYSLTVTNANGCEITSSYDINSCAFAEITLQVMVDPDTDEAISLLDAGDFDSYEWNTGEVSQSIEVSQPGTYSVTVVNSSGCVGEVSYEVEGENIVLASYLVFSTWSEGTDLNFYISHSLQKTNGEPVLTNNTKIEDLIKNSKKFDSLGPQDDNEEFLSFFWVCEESSICLAEHNNQQKIDRQDVAAFRVYSFIVNESDPDNLSLVYSNLENGFTKSYESLIEIPELAFMGTIDHYGSAIKLTNLPAEQALPAEINCTSTINKKSFTDAGWIPDPFPPGVTPPIATMKIKFFEPASEEETNDYAISYQSQIAPETIEIDEFSTASFGILKRNENGTTTPIESINILGVENTFWTFPSQTSGFDLAEFSIEVPEFDIENPEFSLNLLINGNINLNVKIVPKDIPFEAGWHNDPTPEIIAPHTDNNSIDYLEVAKMKISDYDAANEDYDTYSQVFGSNEMSVTFHLEPEIGARSNFDWGESSLRIIEMQPASLRVEVVEEETGVHARCPLSGRFYRVISDGERNDIEMKINDGMPNNQNPYPPIIDRIEEYNLELAMNLIAWCDLPLDAVQERASAISDLNMFFGQEHLAYYPTNSEVEGLLEVDTEAHITVNAGLHNDVYEYAILDLRPSMGSGTISFGNTTTELSKEQMTAWYNSGNGAVIPNYNPNWFNADINFLRCLAYTNTVAHELGHIKYKMTNKVEAYLWDKIIQKYKDSAYDKSDQTNPCFPARIGNESYCSRGDGHEYMNPDNAASCSSVVEDWKSDKFVKVRFY